MWLGRSKTFWFGVLTGTSYVASVIWPEQSDTFHKALQALSGFFGVGAVVSMRHAVKKVDDKVTK